MTNTIRKHIYYTGNVQGVGFRFTVRRFAANYDVTGYVRNIPDGRVELLAQGKKSQIDAFLNDIDLTMRLYVRQTQVTEEPTANDLATFEITY